jgi:triacylglycerol lipase
MPDRLSSHLSQIDNPQMRFRQSSDRSTRNPLLLIHGITDTGYKMRKIANHLDNLGWQVYTIDLTPNNGEARLEILAGQVADLVSRTFSSHQHIDIIAFSMGGLVARYYIQRLGGIDRVQRLITLSSPHRGTLAAYFSARPGCVQMRPHSKFIQDLASDVGILNRLKFTSIWTPFDLIILPPSSSQIGIGTEIMFPVAAHPLMVFDRRCLESIADALSQPVKSPI